MSWIDRNPMTKSELVAELKAKGQFDTNTRNELWMRAFKLYEIETKNKLSPSCGSCYQKVRAWLNS
jgi:hypothetical protein